MQVEGVTEKGIVRVKDGKVSEGGKHPRRGRLDVRRGKNQLTTLTGVRGKPTKISRI